MTYEARNQLEYSNVGAGPMRDWPDYISRHPHLVGESVDCPDEVHVPDGLRVGLDEVGHDPPARHSLAADRAVGGADWAGQAVLDGGKDFR